MKEFHLFNIEVFNQYNLYKNFYHLSDISFPLLVSPNLSKGQNKILYIGQETNTWGRMFEENSSVEKLENAYEEFLEMGPPNTIFWQFVRNLVHSNHLSQHIIWSNVLLCGKKDHLGTPILPKELLFLSSEYLFQLYQSFSPTKVIIASSARSPYYNVISSFLEKAKIDMREFPTSNFPIVSDSFHRIFWTYHPNYLRFSKKTEIVQEEIKKYIK